MSSFDWGTDRATGPGPGQQPGGSPSEPDGSDPSGSEGPAGRRTLIVGVLVALFAVALGWFVVRPMMTGTTNAAAAAPASTSTSTSAGAATPAAPTPSPSDTAAQSAPPTAAEAGTPRNPFISLVTPSASGTPAPNPTETAPATPTASPTSESPAPPQTASTGSSATTQPAASASPQATGEVPLGLGEGSSPAAGYQAPAQADGAEGAASPHGTLALTTITSDGGSVSAVMTWNGKTYRAHPGEQFTKYLTLVDVAGNQALFSYRDQPFALGLHQTHTF